MDPEGTTKMAFVNGASFNYGDRNRQESGFHTRYDVKNTSRLGPSFFAEERWLMEAKFKTPQNIIGSMGYLSAKSVYVPGKESIQRGSQKGTCPF